MREFLAVIKDWDESKHPRGKTTPDSTPGSFAPSDTTGGVTWKDYFREHSGSMTLPLSKLRQMHDSPDDRVAKALSYMKKAAAGEIPKRDAILVREQEDGTYLVLNGNSTFEAAIVLGLDEVPVLE